MLVFSIAIVTAASFLFYSSRHTWHITNITDFSNRTIDYLTAAKPEAYQAHSRRVSATKIANQKRQQAQQEKLGREQKEKESVMKKSENSVSHQKKDAVPPPSHEASAYNLHPDLERALPNDLREHMPKRVAQFPNSAPAVLPSSNKKMAIAQGEIPIGIEPSLSPLASTEMDC